MMKISKYGIIFVAVLLAGLSRAIPIVPIIDPKSNIPVPSPVDRVEAKAREFLTYLKSKKECLKDRTCSKEAIKRLSNMAAMISVLALYAFVGTKAAKALQEETLPVAKKIALEKVPVSEVTEKEWLKFPPVPSGPPLEKEESPGAQAFFNAVQNMHSTVINYVDFIIPEMETRYGLLAKDVEIKGGSLIGAVLMSRTLDVDSKTYLINWLRTHGVEPTEQDKERAEKSANASLGNAVIKSS